MDGILRVTTTTTLVFTNGPGDQGSIPGQIIQKTKKNGT